MSCRHHAFEDNQDIVSDLKLRQSKFVIKTWYAKKKKKKKMVCLLRTTGVHKGVGVTVKQ